MPTPLNIQFNFHLTYTEYYVHKVRMILQLLFNKNRRRGEK